MLSSSALSTRLSLSASRPFSLNWFWMFPSCWMLAHHQFGAQREHNRWRGKIWERRELEMTISSTCVWWGEKKKVKKKFFFENLPHGITFFVKFWKCDSFWTKFFKNVCKISSFSFQIFGYFKKHSKHSVYYSKSPKSRPETFNFFKKPIITLTICYVSTTINTNNW